MKKLLIFTSLLLCLALLTGCSGGNTNTTEEDSITQIKLSDDGIEITGGGAKAEGNVVTIAAVGEYAVSGRLSDGQILVDTGDEAVNVTLILDGADITNLTGPAIHIRQAKDARIQLAAGTKNGVTSGVQADMDKDSADSSGAAIYAEDDLDIEGEGELIVCGYINNGIACKDDLDVNSGNICVYAANNGIRGTKSVEIKGGSIAVTAVNDGIKSTETDKPGKGYIRISGGTLAVQAEGDGISAATELSIEDGVVTAHATGDPALGSSKAIKAGTALTINGGSITAISSEGKAIAAHGDISITGGELVLSGGSDGIETSGDVSISGGSLEISAGDDGIQAGKANTGIGTVTLSGGLVKISAGGRSFNARGELILNGGELFALGGSDKTAVPSAAGTQPFVKVGWQGVSNDALRLLSADGEELITYTSSRTYKHILVSLPCLEEGADYSFSKGWDNIRVTATRNG